MSVARTVLLQGEESEYHEERVAGAAGIVPGDLLEINTDNEVVVHAAAGVRGQVLVAKEDYLQGRTINHPYDDEDVIACHNAQPGHKLNLRLAASQTIATGDYLTSNGDGKVKAVGGGTRIFKAAEAVTTGAGETKRIAAYVI
jgi:hypothetical protein